MAWIFLWQGWFALHTTLQLGLDLGQLILEDNLDFPSSLYRVQWSLLLPALPVRVFEMSAWNSSESVSIQVSTAAIVWYRE